MKPLIAGAWRSEAIGADRRNASGDEFTVGSWRGGAPGLNPEGGVST